LSDMEFVGVWIRVFGFSEFVDGVESEIVECLKIR